MATVTCDDCGDVREIRSWADFGPCPCGQRPDDGPRTCEEYDSENDRAYDLWKDRQGERD